MQSLRSRQVRLWDAAMATTGAENLETLDVLADKDNSGEAPHAVAFGQPGHRRRDEISGQDEGMAGK